MKTRAILYRLILLPLFCAIAIPARAQTGNADFQQAVTSYQQSPSDATAEKAIRMAAAMDQLPPIPEEARRHFVRGTALFKDAKSPDDYKQVLFEFGQATSLAPWWPEARYNRALAWEAAGDYALAIRNLKLYLLFKLSETDARTAQDKIYALEARQEKAGKEAEAKAKESRPEAIAARKQSTFDTFLAGLDGRRYVSIYKAPAGITIDIRGRVFVFGLVNVTDSMGFHPGYRQGGFPGPNPTAIQGMETVVQINSEILVSATFIISADGNSITRHTLRNELPPADEVFLWQR
jgi:tetratricopeptide (TPR) repeat protein